MLTQEDKHWIENLLNTTLDQRLKIERELMRDFIVEGRRQDHVWVKEEFSELRGWVDQRIETGIEDFARTVAVGFNEVHVHLKKLEHPQAVPLF